MLHKASASGTLLTLCASSVLALCSNTEHPTVPCITLCSFVYQEKPCVSSQFVHRAIHQIHTQLTVAALVHGSFHLLQWLPQYESVKRLYQLCVLTQN